MPPAMAVATLCGVGRLRIAPGTWGSLVVLPAVLLGPWWCLALGIAFSLAGFWAVSHLPEAREDPGWVVADEAAGQCLTLAALPPDASFWWVLAGFALFRLADILKPGPVGWADRMGGSLGVMLDDILAGILAGGVLLAARAAGLP
ncbi:phosphatidylglycerophosphatase A family protein [Roseomonas xinghualingensis]|uniref:phosphatidylglycerophosphatase A family protein n=1 Tax=Roseomonas xinghualingensis TaxID=2986475 RepID=UPI0021F1DFA4|nr:phosphatidylglycerophosphatase A [Roseomonas sp. SXEYE001]MCV4206823.1 phosphatidylglycerophosphatase A [Roseomonas sp. SXEYE001]